MSLLDLPQRVNLNPDIVAAWQIKGAVERATRGRAKQLSSSQQAVEAEQQRAVAGDLEAHADRLDPEGATKS